MALCHSSQISVGANMESLGETEIHVSSSIIGKIRALSIGSDLAIFPRLRINVGITLHERRDDANAPEAIRTPYEMRDALGELRLAEHADVVAAVIWAGPRRYVRSSNYGLENQLRFVCDLDFQRLEQIERRRAGASLVFWLQVWPALLAGSQCLDAEVRAFQIRIPRDDWLEFYTNVGGGQFDIIEVQYSPREAEQFKRAVGRVQDARTKIGTGDYDAAVALCRNAIEALRHELEVAENDDAIRALLIRSTDARRAAEYSGIIARLKQLTGFAHHEFGTPMTFGRAEAQFLLRSTEALLALLGRLSTDG